MKVTVYCNTYQRCPYPLEELVYCFLAQDYPKKELVIANDDPDVVIEFDHPDVTVLNYKTRYPVLFDKTINSRRDGTGELMVEWDDDDLYAPWALSSAVRFWKESDKPFVAFPMFYKTTKPGEIQLKKSPTQSTYVLSRDAWEEFNAEYEREDAVGLRLYDLAARNEKKLLTFFKQRKQYSHAKMAEDDIFFLWRISNKKHINWKARPKGNVLDPKVCVLEPKMKYSFEKFGY